MANKNAMSRSGLLRNVLSQEKLLLGRLECSVDEGCAAECHVIGHRQHLLAVSLVEFISDFLGIHFL
jgi:hypothetical protein